MSVRFDPRRRLAVPVMATSPPDGMEMNSSAQAEAGIRNRCQLVFVGILHQRNRWAVISSPYRSACIIFDFRRQPRLREAVDYCFKKRALRSSASLQLIALASSRTSLDLQILSSAFTYFMVHFALSS